MPAPWVLVCRRCGRVWARSERGWRCRCGGLFDLQGPRADPLSPAPKWSLWRYSSSLPCSGERVTLGEGLTPLVPVRPGLWCKLDYVMPTGSFKDRGATVLMSVAAGLGVERVVADSSGNAGRSVAAYAARAGMAAEVYVPESTSPVRVAAVEGLGARVVVVAGDRAAAGEAARSAAEETGAWYASHVYRPEFAHGVKTLAFELHEQLDGPPGTVVVPAGNGSLVLGLWLGFREARRPPAPDRRRAGRTLCATGRPGPDRSDGRVGHRHPGAASRRGGTGCRPGDRRRRRHGPRGRPRPRRRRAGPPGLRRGAHRSSGVGCPAGPRGRS